MHLRVLTLSIMLGSSSLWMTGCAEQKLTVLHDNSVPILEVYDKQGVRLDGYEAYTSGYIATQVKRCEAILDRLDRATK